jgi:hypothetical protein
MNGTTKHVAVRSVTGNATPVTRIQEIQAKIKVENSRHKAEVAKLKAQLEAAR